ncbi:MAG: bifunctional diguanylate cyclase/phosphodiesterase [Candidatus Cloacimonetes bacterium]|nr:bifunctional diguanylate cyclase/phosphodiesterase [Candidatus Cloacimonadota bacterium]
MNKKREKDFLRIFLFPKTATKVIFSICILLLLPLVYYFVYITGGIKFVFSHSMYLPIILASLFWGIKGGFVISIVGGLLLGPLMPIDVYTGEKQLLINWIYRLLFFITISVILGLFRDKLKQNIQKLKYYSTHDEYTGLLNISSLRVDDDIKIFIENSNNHICIVSLLWNNYQDLINMLGIDITTDIIKDLDKRFYDYYKNSYRIIQAGKSSFYLILYGDDIDFIHNQIQHLTDRPIVINNIPFYIEFSIGSVMYDSLGSNDLDSFQKASIAANYSQKKGISPSIFDEDKIVINKNNIQLMGEFPHAVKNGQIILYYQPKFDISTKQPVGMEALVRWIHPEKGMIAPMDFIPVIEESNLIHQLTESVIKQGLEKSKEFIKNKLLYTISINISPKNLINPRFIEIIINLLDKHSMSPDSIEFEITESALMCNPEKVNLILNTLKQFKISLSIDDFGTGYSSLAYLSRFPIDYIKIDQYFIKNLFNIKGINSIIKAAINLSHDLGIKVIAEGIEDEKTCFELMNMGCDIGQGYLYSKPLPSSEIFTFFKTNTL